jgi:hypothetical protein
MNLLPWLLDWPPRLSVVVVVLLITVGSFVGLMVFGGGIDSVSYDEVSIDAVDVSVLLNDDHTYPDEANGSVQTCMASGTPGDSISVRGDVDLTVPPTEESLLLSVSLAHTTEEWTDRVTRAGDISVNVLWILEDDEQLDVGEMSTVQIQLRDGDSTVSNTTADIVVENESRTYDC